MLMITVIIAIIVIIKKKFIFFNCKELSITGGVGNGKERQKGS